MVTVAQVRMKCSECGISEREAALAIGNQLDCAPHEDISGTMFLVPNWAHK